MPLRLRRRGFLRSAGATIAVAVGLHLEGSTAAAQVPIQAISGVLRQIGRRSIVIESPSGRQDVRFHVGATFNRNGASTLDQFQVGDRVVVELATDEQEEQNAGSRMELRYGYSAGTVQQIVSDHITTTAGTFAIDADTVVHVVDDYTRRLNLSDVAAGAAVAIISQLQPTGTHLARRIGVS